MSNSLYLEAITEAKQLREAAEANAKKAIIDAMAPQIKRLVEKELLDESSDDVSDDNFLSEIFGLEDLKESDEDTFTIDEDLLESITTQNNNLTTVQKKSLATLIETFQNAAHLYNEMSDKDENSYTKFESIASNIMTEAKTLRDDIIRIVEGEGTADASSSLVFTLDTIIKETNKMSTRSEDEVLYELDLSELDLFEEDEDEPADLDIEDMDDEEEGDEEAGDDEEGEDDAADEGGDDQVELELDSDDAEALLAALRDALGDEDEEDMEEAEERMYAGEEAMEGEEGEEAMEAMEGEEGEEGEEAMKEGDTDDDEWIEIDEGMLRREIAAMRAIAEGDAKKGAKDFGGGKIGGNKKSPGDDFGGGKRGKDPLEMSEKDLNVHAENKQLRVAYKKEARKNRELNAQLSEVVTAVKDLQGQLKEMNLFNAKLLYANKLLQNKNISTRQMRSIVESLDKARSLREVKLLYKTMTESITSKKKGGSINESTVRKAVGSSRPTRSASAQTSNPEVDRWATLAGLK